MGNRGVTGELVMSIPKTVLKSNSDFNLGTSWG